MPADHPTHMANENALLYLTVDDIEQASSIIRGQVRHAENLSNYVGSGTDTLRRRNRVIDLLRMLRTIHLEVEFGIVPLINELKSQLRLGPLREQEREDRRKFLQTRAQVQHYLETVLQSARRLHRSLRQAIYGRPQESPTPSLFHGLEQLTVSERNDVVAREYQAAAFAYFQPLLRKMGCDYERHPLSISYEYILAANYHHSIFVERDEIRIETQVSVPVWQLYMPRYLPALCHEIVHPYVNACRDFATNKHLRVAIERFEMALEKVMSDALGTAIPGLFPGAVTSTTNEIITDFVSAQVAGPGYQWRSG